MTKENTDQVIRCIKECWWRVGVLLVILIGFALIAIYGWPQGDWQLGWGAIGAVATVITGGIALKIAFLQGKRDRDLQALKEAINFSRIENNAKAVLVAINQVHGIYLAVCKVDTSKEVSLLVDLIKRCRPTLEMSIYLSGFFYEAEGLSVSDIKRINAINESINSLSKGVGLGFIKLDGDDYVPSFFDSLSYFFMVALNILSDIGEMDCLRGRGHDYSKLSIEINKSIANVEKEHEYWSGLLKKKYSL